MNKIINIRDNDLLKKSQKSFIYLFLYIYFFFVEAVKQS